MFHPREIFRRRSYKTKFSLMVSNLLYPPNGEDPYVGPSLVDRNPAYLYPSVTNAGFFYYAQIDMSSAGPLGVLMLVAKLTNMYAIQHYHPSMQSLMESRTHVLWKLEDMMSGRIP